MLSGLLLDTNNISRNGKLPNTLIQSKGHYRFKWPCKEHTCHYIVITKCAKDKLVEKGKSLVVLSLWWVEQDRCYLPSPDLLLQGILAILATKMKSHIFAN